jgi:Tol biopolymer transport system component
MRLRDAVKQNALPSIDDLADPKYFPYQWGHAVCAYIAGRYGDRALPRLLRLAAGTGNLETAFETVLGVGSTELSKDWHEASHSLYAPVLAAAIPLTETGRLVTRARGFGAELNIGPVMSPNGRWMAFLSARSMFSTDLYVADTETGRIVRRLTSTDTDSHYSSIQFIHSAGTWDPSSRLIAIATVVGSRPALAIFDAVSGDRDRDIVLPDVDEILNPSWSPDGLAIAFTGMRQGLTDLYVHDLKSATSRQITNDAFADLHPAWSRDGRHIVFVSDRYSSDLASLRMGPLQLCIADLETGVVQYVPALENAKHINPQWSPDGQALYFIGDPDGVPNVYRLSVATREIQQITALGIGVSGITPSSPALSVSSRTGRLSVSVYDGGRYDIYLWNATEGGVPPKAPGANAASLPPVDRELDVVGALRAHPDEGLPQPQEYSTTPYKGRLSLAGVGQPTAGASISRFGPVGGGGVALLFGDMLGDHVLATAVEVNSGLTGSFSMNDIAFNAGYLNLRRRWNWGVFGGQSPYLAGLTSATELAIAEGGQPVATDREIFYRQTQRSLSSVVSYPFDRARRVEFQAGVTQTSFEQTVKATVYSPVTGQVASETTETSDSAPHLDLVTTAAAYVFDTATFGPTSPVNGQRYRVEVSPAFGSIDYTGVLVDYRRYVMPVPFYTIAGRVLHYGRYGSGGDDPRLYPIFLNAPGLVRGYGTLDASDCVVAAGVCQLNGRLVGSRILMGSAELRLPIFRPLGVSSRMYGPVPVELALFADGGVAWNRGETPSVGGGSRPGVGSAGLAFRVGLGFLVAEFDVARAFQRPSQGWVFGFNLIPGW